jgi:integrase
VKQSQHGRGTVRTVRNDAGEVIGYQALLPRDLSQPPLHKKVSENYRERLGPLQPTEDLARSLLDAAIVELRDKRTLRHGLPVSAHAAAEIQSRYQDARRRYKDDARASRSVSTWRSIDRHWVSKAVWYEFPPNAVQRADVQHFVNWLRDQDGASGDPLSGHFIGNVVQYLRAVFERAGVDPNPADGLTMPEKGEPDVRFLPIEEQFTLFRSSLPLKDRLMIGCGMGAGLRVGELLSFEAADVHLDGDQPHLLVRYGGAKHAPTKGGVVRRVELFEPGLGFWRYWMAEHWAGTVMVFPGPKGGYQKAWPEQFPGWREITPTRLTSHIMRHTYAVSMLSGTWGYAPRSLEFVKEQLGHADIQTTQRYYAAFEAGTWGREVAIMTGRASPDATRDVVTAAVMLGLACASNGAGSSGGGGVSRAILSSRVDPRHSPKSQETPRKRRAREPNGASPHQSIPGLAARFLELAAARDDAAEPVGDELVARVAALPLFEALLQAAAGGPFKIARTIDLAKLVIELSGSLGVVPFSDRRPA